MTITLVALLAILAIHNVSCFSIGLDHHREAKNPNWNDLKIKWGPVPLPNEYFISMPRTVSDALSQGWLPEKNCSQVNGNRYTFKDDRAVILVFNSQGIIAGISTAIPKGLPFNFPSANVAKLMVDEGSFYTLTAYFIDPNTVCSPPIADKQITGDRLVIKGSQLELDIALQQSQISSYWTLGNCFYGMGDHYWADMTGPLNENTNPDNFVPMFLQYTQGRLVGFGWAFNAYLTSPTNRYERPVPSILNYFFKKVPNFVYDPTKSDGLSTLHIYMEDRPMDIYCDA